MNRKFVAKSNFVLRRVLNTKDNIDILKEFIEVMLELKIKEAKINPYLEKIQEYLPSEENYGIADLRIKTEQGEERNIGIQIVDGKHILTKMLLYYAQIHGSQLEYNEYRKFAKTTTINILDFVLDQRLQYHSKMSIKEKAINDIFNNNIDIHIIQLPKFHIKDINNITLKEAWICYLKGQNAKQAIQKSVNIKKLDTLLENYWENEVVE